MRRLAWIACTLGLLSALPAAAQDSHFPPVAFQEEDGSPSTTPVIVKVTNATLTDNADGSVSISTGGGGGNSFETIAVPAGASVVADASTDTLTITETGALVITGTAATDTIDITFAAGGLTTTEISGLDISADTNLTAGDNLTLTDDDLDLDAAVTIATSISSPIFASTTAGVAAAGILRFANAEGINWEAAPAGTDMTLLVDSAEILQASGAFTSGGTITGVAGTFSGLLTANAHLQVGNGATTAGIIAIREDTDAGTNEATLTVPALAADTDYTLPVDDGTDATTELLTTNGAGTLDWITCATLTGSADLCDGTDATGAGGGDPVLIDGVAVTDAAGVDFIGGTGGIDITYSAAASPDTATLDLDGSEISSISFGNNNFTTMTFNAGATDPVITAASGSLTVSTGTFAVPTELIIPVGATVNADGEITHDTTADQLIIGADADVFDPRRVITMTIPVPTDADNFLLGKLPFGITVTDIHAIVDPAGTGESVVIDVQECDATADNCATVDATITADNDGAEDDGALTNGVLDATDWWALDIGAVTGTVTQVSVSIYYQVVGE